MFQPNIVQLPPGAGSAGLQETIVVYPPLLQILQNRGVDRIQKAFPNFNRSDTLKAAPEGLVIKSLDLTRVFKLRLPPRSG